MKLYCHNQTQLSYANMYFPYLLQGMIKLGMKLVVVNWKHTRKPTNWVIVLILWTQSLSKNYFGQPYLNAHECHILYPKVWAMHKCMINSYLLAKSHACACSYQIITYNLKHTSSDPILFIFSLRKKISMIKLFWYFGINYLNIEKVMECHFFHY